MKVYVLLLLLMGFFNENLVFKESNIELTTPIIKDYPIINIKTSYYIEGAGDHESKLSRGVGWGMCGEEEYELGQNRTFTLGYDCHELEQIHLKANEILSQAKIKLISENNCDRTPCGILSNIPSDMVFTHEAKSLDFGVNPKGYKNSLNKFDRLAEGLFLTHASLLAQNYQSNWNIPGYGAELFIHFVKSVDFEEESSTVGWYIPEKYRQKYTNQKIRIKNHNYPANTTKYIIMIGYDDLSGIDEIAETVAHEIGHALGLKHYDVKGNLMSPTGFGNKDLTSKQIETMRSNFSYFRKYGGGVSSYKHVCKKEKYAVNWGETSVDQVTVDVKYNVAIGGKRGLTIYPRFNIREAKGKTLEVTAYFYFKGGDVLKDFNGSYRTTSGFVATSKSIRPCCSNTNYNLDTNYDFYLFIPYEELHVQNGERHNLKFYVEIWDGDIDIAESNFTAFDVY